MQLLVLSPINLHKEQTFAFCVAEIVSSGIMRYITNMPWWYVSLFDV
ncbi:protein of unknown function [Vibrio tapetis subsp. tapetis]|uniref:Uncharacterized protein n=1 Tax=Vibrio tapetis subsp. tapetis TaxID=1671868 RepID=A0A2N8Z924_9VIBR|nr:protein of unknown function [Vibrio tapetis subsp. tapetis]